jgi:hypothetical protein
MESTLVTCEGGQGELMTVTSSEARDSGGGQSQGVPAVITRKAVLGTIRGDSALRGKGGLSAAAGSLFAFSHVACCPA